MKATERVRLKIVTALDRDAWSQREFAERLNKSQPWLAKIVTGENSVRLNDIDAVAAVLKIPTAELLRADENDLVEVTPSELRLLRLFRTMTPELQSHVLALLAATSLPIQPRRKKTGPKRMSAILRQEQHR